jgi:hypothetical protein
MGEVVRLPLLIDRAPLATVLRVAFVAAIRAIGQVDGAACSVGELKHGNSCELILKQGNFCPLDADCNFQVRAVPSMASAGVGMENFNYGPQLTTDCDFNGGCRRRVVLGSRDADAKFQVILLVGRANSRDKAVLGGSR